MQRFYEEINIVNVRSQAGTQIGAKKIDWFLCSSFLKLLSFFPLNIYFYILIIFLRGGSLSPLKLPPTFCAEDCDEAISLLGDAFQNLQLFKSNNFYWGRKWNLKFRRKFQFAVIQISLIPNKFESEECYRRA